MRKALFTLLTFVPLLLAAPPSSAATRPTWAGACHYETDFVYVAMVVYQPDNPSAVVGATVDCHVYEAVNGWIGNHVVTYRYSGQGAVVGANEDVLDLRGKDFMVCHTIYYSTGHVDAFHCDGRSITYSYWGEVLDTANEAQSLAHSLTMIPDPVLCPILAARAPGIPGVVDITPAGDVAVAGSTQWDCPPYDF